MSEHERLLRDMARTTGKPVAIRGFATAPGIRRVIYAMPDGGTGAAESFYDGNGFHYATSPIRRTDSTGTFPITDAGRVAILAEVSNGR